MSPSTQAIAAQLRQLVFYNLDNSSLDNALFFADRLYGLDDRDPDSAHLVALCLYRLGRFQAAYDYSKPRGKEGKHLGCAHIFAQACLYLDRYSEGIMALKEATSLWINRSNWNKHSDTTRQSLPDAAAIYSLLGTLYRRNKDMKHAVDSFVNALKLNPFMWDAFAGLSQSGYPLKTDNIFKFSPDMLAAAKLSNRFPNNPALPSHFAAPSSGVFTPGPANDPFGSSGRPVSLFTRSKTGNGSILGSEGDCLSHASDDVMMEDAGSSSSIPEQAPPAISKSRSKMMLNDGDGSAGSRISGLVSKSKMLFSHSGEGDRASHRRTASALPAVPSETVRRSARLQGDRGRPGAAGTIISEARPGSSSRGSKQSANAATAATTAMGASDDAEAAARSTAMGGTSTGRVGHSRGASSSTIGGSQVHPSDLHELPPPSIEMESWQWLLNLMSCLGAGYYHLQRFECPESLESFMRLPLSQRNTPWVLAQMAKAEYESSNYQAAKEKFAQIQKETPSRIEDMEIYSAVLWLQKDEVGLAYLAHRLHELDRLAPQTWVAIGNSFSLQRDHDQAIRFFRRASQIDPKFAYAYTLQGHEHMENEEFELAKRAYRRALTADSRHYHAWFGLGRVAEREGRFEAAEKHYRFAALINPSNAVLVVRIGVVLQKMGNELAALDQYAVACDLDPRPSLSHLARLHKARVLLNLDRNQEALEELKILREFAPDIPNVHFFLAHAFKKTGDPRSAVDPLTTAWSLDPKAANMIKEQLEAIDGMDAMFDVSVTE